MYRHQASGLWVRDKGDEGIIKEQSSWAALKKVDLKDARVLDMGGHIGSFVLWARTNLSVGRIVSVEPDPSSAKVYAENWRKQKGVELIQAAVVHQGREPIRLYLGRKYPAANSVYPFRGRESIVVKTVPFSDLLNSFTPELIKCDIEGAEYGLDWTLVPDSVRAICMELHQQRPEWLEKQRSLVRVLESKGFKPLRAPRDKITFTKCTIGVWER